MLYFNKIDYKETLRKQKIIFCSKRRERLDILIFFSIDVCLIIFTILCAGYSDFNNPNEQTLVFVFCPLVLTGATYLFYKKLYEKRLWVITTGLNKKENREAIKGILGKWKWQCLYDNSNYCHAVGFLSSPWSRQIIILYENNEILVTVLSLNHGIRIPVISSDIKIWRYLQKHFSSISRRRSRLI